MKKNLNKKIVFIAFLLILTFSLTTQLTQSRLAEKTTHNISYSMHFIHAEYLDADLDSLEDDTRFSVELIFDPSIFDGRTIKLNCYFEIITPSLISYKYSGFIILYSQDCILIFDVFNTVSEPGWYTINFHSNLIYKGITYTSFCTTIFDPPTGQGEEDGGGPTMDI